MALEQHYTMQEVTKLLRVSRTTIDNKVKAGELKKTKLGKRTLFSASEIHRFLENQQGKTH